MKRILNIFTRPFYENLALFTIILLLTTTVDFINAIHNENYKYSIYIILQGFVTSYILTLIPSLFKNKIYRRIASIILIIITFTIFLLDIFCFSTYKYPLNNDIIAIIYQTNFSEAKEFLTTYLNFKIILLLIFSVIIITGIYYAINKLKKNKFLNIILFVLLVISITATIRNNNVLTECFYGKITSFKQEQIPDLKKYKSNPLIETTIETMPKNFVLILGESFNKSHSSLYNYEKNTNPRLDSINDSLIYTFKNVISATGSTNSTYQCILNTYKLEYGDSVKWYTCTSLQEVLSLCGYSSYWISNQNEKGFYDVVATRQAELCDEKYFTKNKFHGDKFSDTYDEEVIPLIKEVIEKGNLNFYFVHLLGSHPKFKKRYPEQFNNFTCKDYLDKPEHQRQTLAYYDNSILYNDYVISEIIKLFEDKETVIIYVPDHGLDIYQTNDDYCGHAIIGNEESLKYAREIPFIIYTSTLYANNNPNIIEKIRNNTEKSFNTVNLMYTIMDILGIKFKTNDDVQKYSLFAN